MANLWVPKTALRDQIMLEKVQACIDLWVNGLVKSSNSLKIRYLDPITSYLEPGLNLSDHLHVSPDYDLITGFLLADTGLTQTARSLQDKKFLRDLVDNSISKLWEIFRNQVDDEDKPNSDISGHVCFEILDQDNRVLAGLRLSDSYAMAFRRGPIQNGLELSPEAFSLALDDLELEYGAVIGSVRISMKDLFEMTSGDVIILDRSSEDSFELTINGLSANRPTSLQIENNQAFLALE